MSIENISKNDFLFFQNDILKDIKSLETTMNKKISQLNQVMIESTKEHESKISKLSDNINELIAKFALHKQGTEHIEKLIQWKGTINDSLIDFKTQINVVNRSLNNAISKYDNIIIDNLSLPGIVGITCKYKNFKEFFEFIYSELKANNIFKEQQLLYNKKNKEDLKNIIKKEETDIIEVKNKANKFCNDKFKEYEKILEDKFNQTQEIVQAARIDNSKCAMDLISKTEELQIYYDKLKEIKKEIYDEFEKELEKFKKEVENNTKLFSINQNDFKIFKQRFTQLSEFIKDIRFQKNIKQKNFEKMANNIDFNKIQKYKDDYDMSLYNEITKDIMAYLNNEKGNEEQKNKIINNRRNKRTSSVIQLNKEQIKNTIYQKFRNSSTKLNFGTPGKFNINKVTPIKQKRNSMVFRQNEFNEMKKKLYNTNTTIKEEETIPRRTNTMINIKSHKQNNVKDIISFSKKSSSSSSSSSSSKLYSRRSSSIKNDNKDNKDKIEKSENKDKSEKSENKDKSENTENKDNKDNYENKEKSENKEEENSNKKDIEIQYNIENKNDNDNEKETFKIIKLNKNINIKKDKLKLNNNINIKEKKMSKEEERLKEIKEEYGNKARLISMDLMASKRFKSKDQNKDIIPLFNNYNNTSIKNKIFEKQRRKTISTTPCLKKSDNFFYSNKNININTDNNINISKILNNNTSLNYNINKVKNNNTSFFPSVFTTSEKKKDKIILFQSSNNLNLNKNNLFSNNSRNVNIKKEQTKNLIEKNFNNINSNSLLENNKINKINTIANDIIKVDINNIKNDFDENKITYENFSIHKNNIIKNVKFMNLTIQNIEKFNINTNIIKEENIKDTIIFRKYNTEGNINENKTKSAKNTKNDDNSSYLSIFEREFEKEKNEKNMSLIKEKINKINIDNEALSTKINSLEDKYIPVIGQMNEISKILSAIYNTIKKEKNNQALTIIQSTTNTINNNKFDITPNKIGNTTIKYNILKDYKTKKGLNLYYPFKNHNSHNITTKNNINEENNNLNNDFYKISKDEMNILLRKIEPFLIKKFSKTKKGED